MTSARPGWVRALGAGLVLGALVVLSGCSGPPGASFAVPAGQPSITCGRLDGPDCNDLLEIGNDALAGPHGDVPAAIALDRCEPDDDCPPSALGGDTAAVVIRWPDGAITWATIPLAPDWPTSRPGTPAVQPVEAPERLGALVD